MEPETWQDRFLNFEPDAFPDLTGLSPRAKQELRGHLSASYQFGVNYNEVRGWSDKTGFGTGELLQAAWAKVLASYSGEVDLCFGFGSGDVDCVPVRISFQNTATNLDVLHELVRHQETFSKPGLVSVHEISEHLAISPKSLAHSGIIFREDSQRHEHIILDRESDVLLEVRLSGEIIQGHLRARKSLVLDCDTPKIFLAFEGALRHLLYDLSLLFLSFSTPVCQVQKAISNAGCQPTAPMVADNIHGLVENHARCQPNATALDFLHSSGNRTKLSFHDLDSLANKVADALISQMRVELEDSVPVCIPKSPEFYICILGVMKAGASFTPFSNVPSERKRFMLDELKAKVVLHAEDEDMSWSHGAVKLNISALLAGAEPEGTHSCSTSRPSVKSSNLVYQMYTSGSTGRPKAVSLEHGNAMQTVMATRTLVPSRPESRMLQYAAPSFDMCYYDTFLAWSLGICLCSASDRAVYNDLSAVVTTLEVDMLGLTPSVAVTLNPEELPNVKWLYCIGEAMPQALVDKWHGRLMNSYGPTEAAQMVTLFQVDPDVKSAVIGKPFANTSFYVMQKGTINVAPVLGVGELYIGGYQVARGYHANDEKTKAMFVNCDGVRLYKTGDLVRMLGNGNFEFIGRDDDQVKVRGQRVELGEIDQAIIELSSEVSRASTHILKVTDQAKGQLVSFVTLRLESSRQKSEIICGQISNRLQASLPSFMVPKIILPIDRIPLSASGKADRKALTANLRQSAGRGSATADFTQQSTEWSENDRIVRDAFAVVAGIEAASITREITIFQLGIDSIGAIQVASILRRNGMYFEPSDIMAHPSVSELVEHIGLAARKNTQDYTQNFCFQDFHKQNVDSAASQAQIETSLIHVVRPCSPLQSGMIAQSLQSDDAIYFNHCTYELMKEFDHLSLKSAWCSLVEKYEVLRTGFLHTNDPRFPFAMMTYKPDSIEMPFHIARGLEKSSKNASQLLREQLVQNLHLPPWKVIIEGNMMSFVAHHSLYDAQVLNLLVRDLARALREVCLGTAVPVEPQLSLLLGPSGDEHPSFGFWKELKNSMVPTKFPVLTPLNNNDQSLWYSSRLCSKSISELEAGCRRNDTTLQVVGQAAWAQILSAYAGEENVTFGTVLSGRNAESSGEIGFPCITTIPTPVLVHRDKHTMLRGLLKFNAGAQKHQFVPLKRIEKLTDHSNEALFDSIFTLQKTHVDAETERMIKLKDNQLAIDYPVSIELEAGPHDTFYLNLYHRLSRIPRQQAEIMLDQFNNFLCDIVSDSSEFLAPNISSADPRIYSKTPAVEKTLPSEASLLHHLFEMTAAKHGYRTALEYVVNIAESDGRIERLSWTYREVEAEGNRVASFLVKSGVRVGSIVAMCFDKCPEAAFTMLGISKAGCSFLALDPLAPQDRKQFILEDSGAAMLITKGSLISDLPSHLQTQIIDLEEVKLQAFDGSHPVLDRDIKAQDLSYCLYTSGTTGLPKGCAVTHENAVQAMLSFQRLYKYTDSSRWLQFASYHFDVSVMEHFWSWSVAMCVVTASRDLIFADLPGAIKKLEISHIDLTPSLARTLDPERLPTLANGVFVVGGEMLRQDILDRWGPTGAIHNAYGPTEATIGVTMYPGVPIDGRPANIGRQFDNVGSYVLNKGNPSKVVLRGALGELCVSGKLVAQGYLNRPDLTAERFVVIEGERCYRTGDLVRILHDGSFDFAGRIDDQVKLRGQRLEIGEINSIIRQSDDSITDVSTLVLRHPKQQKEQLVSFVSLQSSRPKENDSAQISIQHAFSDTLRKAREACESKMPPYMVPTHFLAITKIPLSSNNKADAKQLRSLYAEISLADLQRLSIQKDQESNDVFHSQADHQKIVEVVAMTLGVSTDKISPNSSFFQLGLDSISVIGLVKSLRKSGIATSTATIMRNPSVARLSQALSDSNAKADSKLGGNVMAARQRIRAFQLRHKLNAMIQLDVASEEVEAFAMCTPLQQGIISRAIGNADGTYFNQFRFTNIPSSNLSRLKNAFQAIIDHTQILRTRFVPTDEGYAQIALKTVKVPWEVLRTEIGLDETQSESILNIRHQKWWRHAVESQSLEPVAIFVHCSGQQADVSLSLFHACYDGRSLSRIIECLLGEFHNNTDVNYGPKFYDALPHGPLQNLSSAKSFWNDFLKGVRFTRVKESTSISRTSSNKDFLGHRKVTGIHSLEKCRRDLGVTHQAIFQTSWIAALQDLTGGPTAIGLVLSGASIDLEEADKTIGPIFNTVPFHLSLKEDDCWRDSVRRCHESNTQILPFQHTPLRDIQRWYVESGQEMHDQLFETIFVYQRSQSDIKFLETPWRSSTENIKPDFPLAFEVEQTSEDSLNLTLACQKDFANAEMCDSLFDKFTDCLRALVENADGAITDKVRVHPALQVPVNPRTEQRLSISRDGRDISNSSEKPWHSFEWNGISRGIRDEIAELADLPPPEVDPDTPIVALGLDSVDAVKLSSRLKSRLGLKVSVSRLIRAMTVRNIATLATELRTENDGPKVPQAFNEQKEKLFRYASEQGEVEIRDIIPATPLQEGMIAEMINSGFARYFNHDILKLKPDTDIERLERAWDLVIDCTPLLKSHLLHVSDPGIHSAFAFVETKLTPNLWNHAHHDANDGLDSLMDNIRKEFVSKTRSRHPLLQLTWVHNTNTTRPEHLILSISHALYDGWSIGLIHDCVRSVYGRSDCAAKLKQPSLKPLLEGIVSNHDAASESYWKQTLDGIIPSTLAMRREKPSSASMVHRVEMVCDIPASVIQKFCKKLQITVSTFSQTIWSLALSSLLGRLDVTFGLVLSGRDTEEAQVLRFPTMNTVIARSIVHGSIRDMLRDTQLSLADLSRYQHFPLRKALNLARNQTGGLEPFNSLFIYQKKSFPDQESGPEIYESVGGLSDVEYPLCVEAEIDGTQLIWRLAGKDEYISLADSRSLLENIRSLVQTVLYQPDRQTVRFTGSEVQICEMRAFKPYIHAQVGRETHGKRNEESSLAEDDGRWSSTESSIRQVITRVSGLSEDEVGKRSSLLSLGLDSISAIKISSLLREHNIQLAVNEVLRAGSISSIAKFAEQKAHKLGLTTIQGKQGNREQINDGSQWATCLPRSLDISRLLLGHGFKHESVELLLPATSGQVFMLSKWQNTGLYYSDINIQVSGVDKGDQIQIAWNRLAAQSAILRTIFIATGERDVPVVQVILKNIKAYVTPAFQVAESSTDDHSSPAAEETTGQVFHPVRMVAKDLGRGHWALEIKLSHALFDGYSLHLLLQRFLSCFGQSTELPLSSPAEYLTFTKDVLSYKEDTKSFWKSYLSGLQLRSIPHSKSPTTRRKHLRRPFAVPNFSSFRPYARSQGVSMQSLFIATYATVYARRVGADGRDDDVLIGVYTASRGFDGADLLEMPTLGFVPIRVKAPLRKPISEIARSIQQDLGEISEGFRSSVGLWQLRQWLGSDLVVDTWVNILQGSGSRRLLEGTGDERITILYEEPRENRDDSTPVGTNETGDKTQGLFLEKNSVRDGYQVRRTTLKLEEAIADNVQESLDVETTMYDDSIDIGVIAADGLISSEGATEMLTELSNLLSGSDR